MTMWKLCIQDLDFTDRLDKLAFGASRERMEFFRFAPLKRSTKLLAIALASTIVGCGDDSPPYEVLPLRDALRAAPEVVAGLSHEARYDLALRLRNAQQVESETLTFNPESLSLEPLVTSADSVRESSGKDAFMLGEILATEGHGLVEIDALSDADMTNTEPLDVRGKVDDDVAPFEDAALRGEAGKTLRGFVAHAHAKNVVRMTGLPVAAVAWNDTVYVNESWLVAMSALEDACIVPVVPDVPAGQGQGTTPGKQPLSVDFNPFDLPESLQECRVHVQQVCVCATNQSCGHVPTDETFTNANAECAWVNEAPEHASALCIMALLTVGNVQECVESASPACSKMPVGDRTRAAEFAMDDRCLVILDQCLANGTAPKVDNGSSKCGDSCNDCKYCDGQNNDCAECAQDCATFADACEACIEITGICAQACSESATVKHEPFKYAAIRPVTQCSVRTTTGRSPLPTPMGTALWLFAPLAYLLHRSRRQK